MCSSNDACTDSIVLADNVGADLSQREVRSLIFHILYAADAFDYTESVDVLIDNFNTGFDLKIAHNSVVDATARAIIEERDQLDEMIKPLLHNWRFDRIGLCTKLVLRMAMWELKQRSLDHKIVINEAIELAKCFAEDDAFKFVNGILDEALKVDPSLRHETPTPSVQ